MEYKDWSYLKKKQFAVSQTLLRWKSISRCFASQKDSVLQIAAMYMVEWYLNEL